ncbi:hypothetical protein ODZ83_10150 [Acaricomes phytoseiuli]|nr:hypothetical protein [Acaricomes phytoseiuli]MCW1250531.1 hypothetical protein [Acaricomes phytoseiuli]
MSSEITSRAWNVLSFGSIGVLIAVASLIGLVFLLQIAMAKLLLVSVRRQ